MRHFIPLIAFSLAVAALVLAPQEAEAGETYLGTVINTDAGSGVNVPSNLTTATPFTITARAKLSVQPSAAAYVCVDSVANIDAGLLLSDGGLDQWVQYRVPSCTSTNGVQVAANELFGTSCSSGAQPFMPDGGGVRSCVVSCVPVSGASVTCTTWLRLGDER